MGRKSWTTVILIAALLLIFGISFVLGGQRTNPEERFPGTDSVATSTIEEGNPDYQPWFVPLFQPESGEVESGLFALQAAIGGTIFGFAIGGLWGRRRGQRTPAAPSTDPTLVVEPSA
ncbi:MAG: energy-coupling factor ABC transporter substrate-binding protein [Brooklawnia sp.]|uniref:energy-coupling factor ABC transporter substrate-binding protein n=1 Tax=Brooklawnia sp. TaxID=2699740 RepID=UPI003C709BC1